jgi:hypothetical protein
LPITFVFTHLNYKSMTWEDIITHGVEDRELTEWRGRISKGQKKQLQELEAELNVPQAAMVRMALKTFLPLLENRGFKKEGIKNLYNERKF